MYQALYRKWRPRTFSDVCGQEAVTAALKNELKNGRLSHAYLFTGCRGTGKTTCAKILAKAVNCQHPAEGDPCNECAICRGIDDGSILDVTEIDAASNNGVDNIRELREEVSFTPVNGKYRVYIIDEVHMLSSGAFNALLKTLEEPPAHVIFVLATTEVHKIPATILSRCQRFDFNRIAPEVIASRVQYVAQQEGLTVTDDAAMLLARLADGAMRDALSLLDQCASGNDTIDARAVAEATGMAGRQVLGELTKCVLNKDGAAGLACLDRLYQSAKDMERLCAEWIGYLRDWMILKSVSDPGDLVLASPEELDEMRAASREADLPTVLHMMSVLQATLDRLKGGVSRRVEMEMAVLKLCDPTLNPDIPALTRRVAALESAVSRGVPPAAAPEPPATSAAPASEAPEKAPEPVPEPAPEPPTPQSEETENGGTENGGTENGGETVFNRWGDVLETLSATCMPLCSVLNGSTAVISGGMLTVCTDNALFKTIYMQDDNKNLLMNAIRQVDPGVSRIGLRRTQTVAKTDDPLSRLIDAGRTAGVKISEE